MSPEEKIRELELEIARLNGEVAGLRQALPVQPIIFPYTPPDDPPWTIPPQPYPTGPTWAHP